MKIIQFTQEHKHYFREAVHLLNRTQGKDLFPANYLELRTEDPCSYVVAALVDNRLVGIGIAQLIDNFDFYLAFDSQMSLELKDKKVGSFSTLAITEDLQGKGIGQKISHERLRWLKEHGCTTILGVSWVSGLKHTSDRVFEKMGFRAIKRVDGLFKEMCLKTPFNCPGCRVMPCECAGVLYRWGE